MVLGAHLFRISSKELINLSSRAEKQNIHMDVILNSALTTFNNIHELGSKQRQETEETN